MASYTQFACVYEDTPLFCVFITNTHLWIHMRLLGLCPFSCKTTADHFKIIWNPLSCNMTAFATCTTSIFETNTWNVCRYKFSREMGVTIPPNKRHFTPNKTANTWWNNAPPQDLLTTLEGQQYCSGACNLCVSGLQITGRTQCRCFDQVQTKHQQKHSIITK